MFPNCLQPSEKRAYYKLPHVLISNQKAAQLLVHIVTGNPHSAIPPPW
jgi:hypothetical protein